MQRTKRIGYRFIVGLLVLNFIWYIASLLLPKTVIISPIAVYKHIPNLLRGAMLQHLLASLWRLLVGIAISLVLGVAIAFCMFRFHRFGKITSAFTYLAYPIPKIALLPIVMLIAGLGNLGKITMIVLILLFQVIVTMRDSLGKIPKEHFLVATSLGASHIKIIHHILIPSTLPDLLSSVRVAIGTAISVLFVTETYGTDRGMGFFIIDSWMRFNYYDMYGGIVVLSVAGFILFLLTDLAEGWLCPWKEVNNQKGI